jgi:hypothetical protein
MWISCRIKTESHSLNEDAFAILRNEAANIRASEFTANTFKLSAKSALPESSPLSDHLHHGHHVVLSFLVSINVCCLGMFFFEAEPWVHPVLEVTPEINSTEIDYRSIVQSHSEHIADIRAITDLEVENAIIIFGLFARNKAEIWEAEYIKGLLLLRISFYSINFRREAFLCFYRAFENFATQKILQIKRLNNEKRDLLAALAKLGADEPLLKLFEEVYVVRSSHVAHAQIKQREITANEAISAKIFLDFVLFKVFRSEAEHIMAKITQGRKRVSTETGY